MCCKFRLYGLLNFLSVLKVHMVFLSNMKEVSDGSWDSSDTCVSLMHYQDMSKLLSLGKISLRIPLLRYASIKSWSIDYK